MKELRTFSTPQLPTIHQGKVRDSLRVDDERRLIVVTDRISCFDKNLDTLLPNKGRILNGLSNAWFLKTQHIINNHVIDRVDPCATLVKEAQPIRVEMIVRSYLTGSIWRKYEKGVREVCGVKLPDGMKRNDPFPEPIITPTTKDVIDVDISPEGIVEAGLVSAKLYAEMAKKSLELFEFGSELCESKGIILVDTKYEFGLLGGKLILIDEIHTPDSSRFWLKEDYEKDSSSERWMDKEFIRLWLLSERKEGREHTSLPQEIVDEAVERYSTLYQTLLGEDLSKCKADVGGRLRGNLQRAGLMRDAYVAIVMASTRDQKHVEKLIKGLEKYRVAILLRIVSAHKNGEEIVSMLEEYNHSAEPGAILAVAGRSNGLGGALSANTSLPVINCPPFQDKVDMLTNIQSSLMMPSEAPASTVIDPDNAAKMAVRSLNLQRIKSLINDEILEVKKALKEEDALLKKKNIGVGVEITEG
ncbi:Phosphoribosylaminoimidazole-succinocarboxamide synthase [Chlamydiales bacterium SCGC AG-110-M15]|nr:Phosphoribosylaminoimidazole-succinocarboxamide synthase [Chlamydiales bacterium SCGC AG-110-M15]